MKYLLDTCVISDFVKGEQNTLDRIKNSSPTDIAISSMTVMEIQYDLMLNPAYANKIKSVMSDFLSLVTILNFDSNDAAQAAMARALLKQQGCPIGSYDILLAGVALNHKLIMVTANTREFDRVSGIKLENWRHV